MVVHVFTFHKYTHEKKKQKKMNKKRPDPYRLPPPFIFVFSTAFYLSFLNLSLDAEHTMHLSCVMARGREGSTDNPLNKPPLQWPTTTQHYCSPHSNAHTAQQHWDLISQTRKPQLKLLPPILDNMMPRHQQPWGRFCPLQSIVQNQRHGAYQSPPFQDLLG